MDEGRPQVSVEAETVITIRCDGCGKVTRHRRGTSPPGWLRWGIDGVRKDACSLNCHGDIVDAAVAMRQ
jgi:hypothetical protein